MCFFYTGWTFHSFLVFFCRCCFCFFIPYKKLHGRRIQKHQEVTLWQDLTLGQQGCMWKGGGATMSQTQDYFPSSLLERSESDCFAGIGNVSGGRLVSYSGCRQEGTHFRHPNRRGPQRTRALGWPHPSGLHHPQSNLSEEGEGK